MEQLNPETNVELQNLVQLISGIKDFNNRNSWSSNFARGFASGLSSAIRGGSREEIADSMILGSKNDATGQAEILHEKFRSTITNTGLEPVLNQSEFDAKSIIFAHPEIELDGEVPSQDIVKLELQNINSDRISLNLLDAGQLIKFLGSLQLASVRGESSIEAFNFIAEEIDQLVIRNYILGLFEHSEHDPALLDNVSQISSEFRRLGLDLAFTKISEHLDYAIQGTLGSKLIAEDAQILPGEGFKPHNWHQDIDSDGLEKRWTEALDALDMIKQNPKAKSIFSECSNYLVDSIEIAFQFCDVIRDDYYQDRLPDFKAVLKRAKLKLDLITSLE